jgi:hypothetical protein
LGTASGNQVSKAGETPRADGTHVLHYLKEVTSHYARFDVSMAQDTQSSNISGYDIELRMRNRQIPNPGFGDRPNALNAELLPTITYELHAVFSRSVDKLLKAQLFPRRTETL